jgi:Flp pilus assembly protein TadB
MNFVSLFAGTGVLLIGVAGVLLITGNPLAAEIFLVVAALDFGMAFRLATSKKMKRASTENA